MLIVRVIIIHPSCILDHDQSRQQLQSIAIVLELTLTLARGARCFSMAVARVVLFINSLPTLRWQLLLHVCISMQIN